MVILTVKHQGAISAETNRIQVFYGRDSLDWNRIVSGGVVWPYPDNGIADKPIKLDRVSVSVDRPDDQIARVARRRRNGVEVLEGLHAVWVEIQRSVNGPIQVKVGLQARRKKIPRWADPVSSEINVLSRVGANRSFRASDADLDLSLGLNA